MATSASEVSVCSHLFTVKGYSHTRGIGVGSAIGSPVFDAAGHRWSVLFFPDGDEQDAGGHISISLKLVDGSGSGAGNVTVLYGLSLVDPSGAAPGPEACKVPRVSTFGHWPRGVGCFMKHQTFEASPYLRDDCFTIKCVIGTVEGPGPSPPPAAASELHLDFDRLVVDGDSAEDATSDDD